MISDIDTINNGCPLCTNIKRLEAYLLAPDEVIFFDWLTIKQSAIFGYKTFYYPFHRIHKETRIKRCSLDRIIKRFEAIGILTTETRQKPNEVGRTKYYRMNFAEVVKRLPEIIDCNHESAKSFKAYFNALARMQTKAERGKLQPSVSEQRTDINSTNLYNTLVETYKQRIARYNAGQVTADIPIRKKTPTQLTRNRSINNRLGMLSKRYNEASVKMAFIAYCDAILTGKDNVKAVHNIMTYFLTYDEVEDCFTVVDAFLAYFQQNYSYQN